MNTPPGKFISAPRRCGLLVSVALATIGMTATSCRAPSPNTAPVENERPTAPAVASQVPDPGPAPAPAPQPRKPASPPADRAPAQASEGPALWQLDSDPADAPDFVALCDDATRESHERMVHFLARLAEWSKESHPYVGDDGYTQLLEAYAHSDPSTVTGMRDSALQLLQIGKHRLRLGLVDEALDAFSSVRNLLEQQELGVPGLLESAEYHLGLSYMRKAENSNCVHHRMEESCILPLAGGGIHADPYPSHQAIAHFKAVLARRPDHITSIWLMNVALMSLGDADVDVPREYILPPATFTSKIDFPRFPNRAGAAGVDIMSLAGGAVADDFNNDGHLDLFVTSWDPAESARYFENTGRGQFTERTQDYGLSGITGGLNLVQADYDNDGWTDIFILRGAWLGAKGRHPNSLLRNEEGLRFRDVTFDVGLGDVHYPTQTAAWADFDNDGDLDLFIGNEGFPAQLFRNDGPRFADVASEAGIQPLAANGKTVWTKGSTWGDFDNDGFPDLYLSNLGAPNSLYHNNGDGTFTDIAKEAGVTRPEDGFPTWFWDVNNDGNLDLFAASYRSFVDDVALAYGQRPQRSPEDRLYLGDGTGNFREVSREYGIGGPTAPMGANFGDLNNDGFPDFYLGTGYPGYEALVPNLMFLNMQGSRFEDVTFAGGFGHLQKGHAVAFADLDNDGDQDVFEEIGGAYKGDAFANALFLNPGFANNWITLDLEGAQSNRSAIGARIRIRIRENDTTRDIHSVVNSGGSFGANPLRREIGLGQASVVEEIEIVWPASGLIQRFPEVPANQFMKIREGDASYEAVPAAPDADATDPGPR